MTQEKSTNSHPVLLFDGVCNLCSGTVQTVIHWDEKAQFRFASLQSEAARELLAPFSYDAGSLQSVVVVAGGQIFTNSDAVLEIFRRLGGWWKALLVFKILPRRLRDTLYEWVARNRYRWFGKKEACWLPTPELRQRFL